MKDPEFSYVDYPIAEGSVFSGKNPVDKSPQPANRDAGDRGER